MTLAVPLLVTALVAGADPGDKAPAIAWRETILVKEKDLTVRLKVLAKASLAETGWMALEFENLGERPLTVSNTHYWITAEYGRLGTDAPTASGSLASGSSYDLFPQAWATTPVAPIVLPPGKTHRALEQPSDYSTALLGLPPLPGWAVRGRIFIAVNLSDGRELRAAEMGGLPFRFDWLYPDDAGFKTLRDRLGKLLRAPENKPHHGYILGTYLRIPEVARSATLDQLLAALALRRAAFEGRGEIAAHLAKRFGNDPAVTAYYSQRLQDGDDVVLSDLLQTTLWDNSHVKPLVRLYESNSSKYHGALAVLHKHRGDWIKDADISRRLSAVVQRQYPAARQNPRGLKVEELERWAHAVDNLSMTGDKTAITLLSPALEDKRAFRSTKRLSMPARMRVPPLRVADVALDAILTLLDGSPDEAYRRAESKPTDRANLDAGYAVLRDRMIMDLKNRLAAPDKGK
jgi:hypothetical protein